MSTVTLSIFASAALAPIESQETQLLQPLLAIIAKMVAKIVANNVKVSDYVTGLIPIYLHLSPFIRFLIISFPFQYKPIIESCNICYRFSRSPTNLF